MSSEKFCVVPHPTPRPSQLKTAKRHSRVEDAVASMGTGVVLTPGGRLVAFHESHLSTVTRLGGAA